MIDPIAETPTDKTVTHGYDQAGNRLTTTDRIGETTRVTYDGANRAVSIEYLADGTSQSSAYDQYGDKVQISNPDVTYTYTYDNRRQMTSKTDSRSGKSLAWTFDAAGNVTGKTDYQGDVTSYTYDNSNRLVAMQNPAYLSASYHYDGAGRLLSRILSNAMSTLYNYDKDGFLTQMNQRGADGAVIDDRAYGHDDVGNITSIARAGAQTTTYGYDPVYRLLSLDSSDSSLNQSYTYDDVGNRLSMTLSGVDYHYLYNNNGNRLDELRVTSPTGPILYRYDYDDNGSRIQGLTDSSRIGFTLNR